MKQEYCFSSNGVFIRKRLQLIGQAQGFGLYFHCRFESSTGLFRSKQAPEKNSARLRMRSSGMEGETLSCWAEFCLSSRKFIVRGREPEPGVAIVACRVAKWGGFRKFSYRVVFKRINGKFVIADWTWRLWNWLMNGEFFVTFNGTFKCWVKNDLRVKKFRR